MKEKTNKDEIFFSVKDLIIEYASGGEAIHAVNEVSFELEKGSTMRALKKTTFFVEVVFLVFGSG